jgi:hypothetical protein
VIVAELINETVVEGKRLGRHINHDPRSLSFLVPEVDSVSSVSWPRHIPILDQGNLGSCTGNAATGALGSSPYYETLVGQIASGLVLDENEAVKLYSLATQLDAYPGQYPPDDTGSDGLSVAKAAQQDGFVNGYLHATDLNTMITALQVGPVIVGVNWYTSMDNPDSTGYVEITPSATVRGGHEFVVRAVDISTQMFTENDNSWGPSWGNAGSFQFNYTTMTRLLAEQGDCTSFVPINQPAPTPQPPTPTPTPTPTPQEIARDIDKILLRNATKAVKNTKAFKAWVNSQTGW